jgi:hypothetical protein
MGRHEKRSPRATVIGLRLANRTDLGAYFSMGLAGYRFLSR